MTSQPWSVRRVASDVSISSGESMSEAQTYNLKGGEYITIPHELHMRNPGYFPEPDKFVPGRFLVQEENGSRTAEMGTIRPFGGGASMCKGRLYAEGECLALVAGVLALWEFEPVGERGWAVPEMTKTSGVSRPKKDTRVRVRRRKIA